METKICFCILNFTMSVGKGKSSNKNSFGRNLCRGKVPSLELRKKIS